MIHDDLHTFGEVTRADLDRLREEMRQEFRLEGDGNLIAVDQGESGKQIRLLAALGEANDDDPVFSSTYDPTAGTYTIAWRDFYVNVKYWRDVDSGSASYKVWKQMKVTAGQFVFNATGIAVGSFINLQLMLEGGVGMYNSSPVLYWSSDVSVTGSDTATQEKKTLQTSNNRIGNIIYSFEGVGPVLSPPVPVGPNSDPFMAEVNYSYDETAKTVYVPLRISSFATAYSLVLGNSFDGFLYLGWTAPVTTGDGSYTIDDDPSSYDDYQTIGRFKTDSNGKLTEGVIYSNDIIKTFGSTVFFPDNNGKTWYFSEGLIKTT